LGEGKRCRAYRCSRLKVIRSYKKTPFFIVGTGDDPVAVVKDLKQQQGKDIWLCGGGNLATTLFSEIDELILKVNPFLLGSGITLFAGIFKQTVLELTNSKVYNNGFMLLHYRVKH
jgi:dihydrofolate reductase